MRSIETLFQKNNMDALKDLANVPDFGRWDWTALYRVHEFKWTYGQTPFSNLQFPLVMTVGYLISLFALKVR